MFVVGAGPSKGVEASGASVPESSADAFSPQRFPLISDIKYQQPMVRGIPELPVFTFSFAFVGILLVCSGMFGTLAQSPVPSAGVLVLVLSLPAYVIEKLLIRKTLVAHQSSQRACIQEVRALREEITSYLTSLDRRTTRYFHCVTNSKVTTYFILRQIENALAEQVVEFDRFLSSLSQENLFRAQERLRGTLEYRDGFTFNSGRALHSPMHLLPARLQELVYDLERGITALESEIETFRHEATGIHSEPLAPEPERQLALPLTGASPLPKALAPDPEDSTR